MDRSSLDRRKAFLTLFLLTSLQLAAAHAVDQPAAGNAAGEKEQNNKEARPARQGQQDKEKPEKANEKQPRRPAQGQLRLNIMVQPGRAPMVPAPANAGNGGLEDSVIFARDREAEQLLKKAAAFLEEKRFGEAARALGAIIEAPEDFFFQSDPSSPIHKSLRVEAERLLGAMPREGREAYELQFGQQAAELLKQALQQRNWNKLMEVSRRFFHTAAGYRGTYLLALYLLDQQRPLAAGLCLERLQTAADASKSLEPGLSLHLATAWLRAGLAEKASRTLESAKAKFADADLLVEGKQVAWFRQDSKALSWLQEQLGPQPPTSGMHRQQWAMNRGDTARNATTQGSAPLLDTEGDCWSIPNVDDSGVRRLVQSLRQTYRDAGLSALPALQPLAVDNIVLMRTLSTLLAVDFETGKRLWNVPVDENWGEVTDLHGVIAQQGNSSQVLSLVDQRLWDDATYGTLASDGHDVFSVEDLNFTLPGSNHQPRIVVLPNGRRIPAPSWPRSFNRLAAHDIHTGKLKWELGGPTGEYELPMAGAFFLGPPLPLGDLVYSIAEQNGEIRLSAIDARNGEIQWRQQLAVVELDVLQDASRRFSGVSPSYADGVLVCPTGSGAVVALDIATRSLLWGYRYQNSMSNQPTLIGRRIGAMVMFAGRPREETDRWMDSAAIIAGGRVLVTPIESNEIHCLNLLDGKLLWKKPRGDNLYIACIHDQKVILTGRNSVQALRLADGEPAWPSKIDFASGSAPSGRGFMSGDRYFLPMSTAEVVAIDLEQGTIDQRSHSRKGRVPGNLICYRGMIISQTLESLDTFFELETLNQQVARAIEANPDDPKALTQRGAIELHNGHTEQAIADLRKAFQLAPTAGTREILVDALFDGLAVDFPRYARHSRQLEELISTPEEKSRFIRLMAQGLEHQEKYREAFDMYAQLADESFGALTVDALETNRRARRDRWTQAGLASLYGHLSAADRDEIDRTIESQGEQAATAEGPEPLKRFIQFFGFHSAAGRARDRLAQRLAAAGDWLGAELLWRQVAKTANSEVSHPAAVRLALAMRSAGRPEAAAFYTRRLSGELADVVCLDHKTGRQWSEELRQDSAIRACLQADLIWPKGRIVKEREDRQNPVRYFAAEFTGRAGIYPGVIAVEMSQDRQTIIGRDSNGRERWKASLGDPSLRHNLSPSVLQARAVGNLVVVSLGGQVMAIDTLAPGPAGMSRVLWTQDTNDSVPGFNNHVGVHVRQTDLPWGQHRNMVSDGFGRPVGILGELAEDCFCRQRGRELQGLDPVTGEVLWARGDVEPASEDFGDEELLFVVPPNAAEALVLRAGDGSELGRRPVPWFAQRVATLGRRLVVWQSEAGKSVFAMTDVWEQKPIWRHEFPPDSKAYQVDGQTLGVVDPKGRFVVIDLSDGRLAIDSPIEAEPALHNIYLLSSHDRLLLFTNRPASNNDNGVSVQAVPGLQNNPLLVGMAYGFDRETGRLLWKWKVDKQGLTLDQPRDLPVLVFASRVYERQVGPGGVNAEPYTSIVCLDKRTGTVAYQERIKGHLPIFEVVTEPDEHLITLKLLRHSVKMKFTDEPAEEKNEGSAENRPSTSSQKKNADRTDKPESQDQTEKQEQAERPAPAPDEQSSLPPRNAPIRLETTRAILPFLCAPVNLDGGFQPARSCLFV